jgi:hypothetical protein
MRFYRKTSRENVPITALDYFGSSTTHSTGGRFESVDAGARRREPDGPATVSAHALKRRSVYLNKKKGYSPRHFHARQ